jgi:hypothetical protein
MDGSTKRTGAGPFVQASCSLVIHRACYGLPLAPAKWTDCVRSVKSNGHLKANPMKPYDLLVL